MKMKNFVIQCQKAAEKAGERLVELRGTVDVREKGPADLVTAADLASQQIIFDELNGHFPEFGFIGEEEIDEISKISGEYCWIVDPLDGTTNYVHGLDNFSISIGLRHLDEIVMGLVHDPIRAETFWATKDDGAYLNGKPLRVSKTTKASQALVAASFSPKIDRESAEIKRFVEAVCECQAVRRLGSAALNLCYVAAGRLDAYWATSLKIWDLAAGVHIVDEAGGEICAIDGGPFQLENARFIAASTSQLQSELVNILRRAEA